MKRHLTNKEKIVIGLGTLGLSCLFTTECEFSKLMDSPDSVHVTQVTEQVVAVCEKDVCKI